MVPSGHDARAGDDALFDRLPDTVVGEARILGARGTSRTTASGGAAGARCASARSGRHVTARAMAIDICMQFILGRHRR